MKQLFSLPLLLLTSMTVQAMNTNNLFSLTTHAAIGTIDFANLDSTAISPSIESVTVQFFTDAQCSTPVQGKTSTTLSGGNRNLGQIAPQTFAQTPVSGSALKLLYGQGSFAGYTKFNSWTFQGASVSGNDTLCFAITCTEVTCTGSGGNLGALILTNQG